LSRNLRDNYGENAIRSQTTNKHSSLRLVEQSPPL
jgi:hypothetical protein